MEYYINPSWVYWINVLDWVEGIALFSMILCGVACIVAFIIMMENRSFGKDDEDYKTAKKFTITFLVLTVVFMLIAVFVPSKTVMIEMLIAKLATKQNVELTVESLKSVVDYVVDAIKTLK